MALVADCPKCHGARCMACGQKGMEEATTQANSLPKMWWQEKQNLRLSHMQRSRHDFGSLLRV